MQQNDTISACRPIMLGHCDRDISMEKGRKIILEHSDTSLSEVPRRLSS